MGNRPPQVRIPVDLPAYGALVEWAAEVAIPVEELVLRLLNRYLHPPHAERDPVDDRIGESLLARMGRQGHISKDAVARFREATDELLLESSPAAARLSPRARQLTGELARLFSADAELAGRLVAAERKLHSANDRLWSGLDPEGLEAIYGDHAQFEAIQLEAAVDSRSEVLESTDPLGELQKVRREIHRAQSAYQQAGEDRRHLAADIGEQTAALVAELVAGGFSEEQARNLDVQQLASTGRSASRLQEVRIEHRADAPVGVDASSSARDGNWRSPLRAKPVNWSARTGRETTFRRASSQAIAFVVRSTLARHAQQPPLPYSRFSS